MSRLARYVLSVVVCAFVLTSVVNAGQAPVRLPPRPPSAQRTASSDPPAASAEVAQFIPVQADAEGDRLRAMEDRIRYLEGLAPETEEGETRQQNGKTPELDKPTVFWTGELQVDWIMIDQSAANTEVLGDLENFSDLRRARLGAIGNLFPNTLYRIEFEFAQNGRPTFLDVYGQLIEIPLLHNIRIGHFFEPWSLQRLTSNRYQTFLERPLLDAFAPARNLGVMAFSTWNEGDGTWAIGTFSGESNDVSELQTDHGGQSVTGRVTWLPYFDDSCKGFFRYMHLGACYSYRQVGDRNMAFANFPGARPGAFDNIFWPPWVNTGQIPTNHFQLFDVEWAIVQGPLHVQAECAANLLDQFDGPQLTFWAWYVETGWFLTNDSRPYQREQAVFNRVFPTRPLMFPGMSKTRVAPGWGAWQVAFRADYLNLDSNNVQGGRLMDLTLSLNWYLNPYTRIYADYIHPFLTRDTPQATTEANLFGLRAQFEF